MKYLPLLAVLALASCKKEVTEAEYNQSKSKFEQIGRDIGGAEYSLGKETESGKTALLAERLSSAKKSLSDAIISEKSLISEAEAKDIVEANRVSTITFLKDADRKDETRDVGLR